MIVGGEIGSSCGYGPGQDGFDGALLLPHQRQGDDNAVNPDELAEKDRQRRHGRLPSLNQHCLVPATCHRFILCPRDAGCKNGR